MKSVKHVVEALRETLVRFPAEKLSVYECMKHLGTNHAMISGRTKFIRPYVSSLGNSRAINLSSYRDLLFHRNYYN
jgi:hypothetical protein